jgi:hypothetical protein
MDAQLSRESLLAGYTINGAKQLRLADKIGSGRSRICAFCAQTSSQWNPVRSARSSSTP